MFLRVIEKKELKEDTTPAWQRTRDGPHPSLPGVSKEAQIRLSLQRGCAHLPPMPEDKLLSIFFATLFGLMDVAGESSL